MRRPLTVLVVLLGVAAMMAPAFGATLLLEEFSASTTITGGVDINLKTAVTTDDNLNKWLGFGWTIQSSGGDYFAQQNVGQLVDDTNLMFYGLSATGVASGTPLTLDFDYQVADRSAFAIVAGLNYGVNDLDPFAPWFDLYGSLDADDGVILGQFNVPADYGPDDGWQHGQLAFTLPTAYDVFVVGFAMGGSTGFRAVDNVNFQSVPEPSTLLLLGSGLVGLVGYRRMKRMA